MRDIHDGPIADSALFAFDEGQFERIAMTLIMAYQVPDIVDLTPLESSALHTPPASWLTQPPALARVALPR